MKNLTLLLITEDAELSGGKYNCKDEIVKRLPFKNLNKAINYIILNTKQVFIQLSQAFIEVLFFQCFDLKCHI